MPLFELEKVVRLRPAEQAVLRWSCRAGSFVGGVWCVLSAMSMLSGDSMQALPLLMAWVWIVTGVAAALLWLALAAERPIREVGGRASTLLVAVFTIRIIESLLYVFNGGGLFFVYTFLALLGLWTAWSMEGVEQAGLTRLTFLAGVFGFLLVIFGALAVGNVLSGVQPLGDVFRVLAPQGVLLLPHVLFVWGAWRYKHVFLTPSPEDGVFEDEGGNR